MLQTPHNATPDPAAPTNGILPELVGFNLRLAYYRATQLFAETFADIALTPIQFAILEALAHAPGMTQRELADRIGSAPSVLVQPLRDLEQQGWLSRSADPADRRTNRLRLTPAGEQLQHNARRRIGRVEAALLAELSAAEQVTLLTLLQRISHNPT